MVIEFGHFSLILAFFLTLSSSMLSIPYFRNYGLNTLYINKLLTIFSFTFILFAFLSLVYSFINSDFSSELVVKHSHSEKPLIYKISGVWGNHEGSLLLWILILSLFCTIFIFVKSKIDPLLRTMICSIQNLITSVFIAFSIFTSNPFLRLDPAPLEGNGLNPILQDIGLAMHPPMLYLGYVGLSLTFSFALAGLILNKINSSWANFVKPWITISWVTLTLGISLGSWWAYYELGWGGWWFWDPVENVSLMPWLVATALLHSIIVLSKRNHLKSWTVLLSISAFSLSILGTFIVRSGLLTSVHSFANDPERGIFILLILFFFTGTALIIYAIKGPKLVSNHNFDLISRETALIINNFLLIVGTIIVLIGTFYPLILEIISNTKITVGAPFFEATFYPIMSILVFFMVLGPFLNWKKGFLTRRKILFVLLLIFSIVFLLLIDSTFNEISFSALLGITLFFYLFFGVIFDILSKIKPWNTKNIPLNFKRLDNNIVGMWIAHIGMSLFIFGAVAENIFSSEKFVRLSPSENVIFMNKEFKLEQIKELKIDNYNSLTASLQFVSDDGKIIRLNPEKRFYPAGNQMTTEAAIHSKLNGDFYVVLGDFNKTQGYVFKFYYKAYMFWIWIGVFLMAFGGIVSILNRKNFQPRDQINA